MNKNPVIYVFVNKSLNMSVGKVAAQVGHAVALMLSRSDVEKSRDWSASSKRMVVVLEAKDELHMLRIREHLLSRGIDVYTVIDEGVNEVEPQSMTAMATGILDRSDSDTTEMFRNSFKTYRDAVRVTLEVDR